MNSAVVRPLIFNFQGGLHVKLLFQSSRGDCCMACILQLNVKAKLGGANKGLHIIREYSQIIRNRSRFFFLIVLSRYSLPGYGPNELDFKKKKKQFNAL